MMNKEQLIEEVEKHLSEIRMLKEEYINENKEFDVNERVRIVPLKGHYDRIAEVSEIISTNDGKIIYKLFKVTKDGVTVNNEYKLNRNEKIVKLNNK